jgi:hypothetical protein
MISKQTKVLFLVGIICLASALLWQNYSRIVFELTHDRGEVKIGPKENGGWDPNALWVHQPAGSDFLLLLGTLALLFTVPSLVDDIKRSRRHL